MILFRFYKKLIIQRTNFYQLNHSPNLFVLLVYIPNRSRRPIIFVIFMLQIKSCWVLLFVNHCEQPNKKNSISYPTFVHSFFICMIMVMDTLLLCFIFFLFFNSNLCFLFIFYFAHKFNRSFVILIMQKIKYVPDESTHIILFQIMPKQKAKKPPNNLVSDDVLKA